MATPRQVTIIGTDSDGYTWVCGHCPESAPQPLPTREEACEAFDAHYDSAPSVANPGWINELLTAGEQLATAAQTAAAWEQILTAAPAETIAAWRRPGQVHPVR
ncbi:hypothetical protein [Streptomyces beijiangensis]|uniref:Uncharacterized protein n=1 Tax=Streptomyces beijiangensis TaxID=163361 RepID=A0A939JK01_9ACTN|nr:hypothetical protein [Streptomyces beijiangensis]MBO0514790.1 hypothetical protein [Streptomyces beijiangensis]